MKPIPYDIGLYMDYEPDTGLIRWSTPTSPCRQPGDVAGSIKHDGYVSIGFQYQEWQAHRIAWFLAYGEQPPPLLDHINLHKSDNRLCNLRPATPSLNNANQPPRGSRQKGVTKLASGRYQAQIGCRGKNHYLGCFDTPEEAAAAYASKAQELFGEYARAA